VLAHVRILTPADVNARTLELEGAFDGEAVHLVA
jgi:hypothetical protein